MSRPLQQMWRDSATLILIARSNIARTPFNYRVLFLQRSEKSRFMPNRYVFPGGVMEKADFSEEWIDLFGKSSNGSNFSSLVNMKEPRPPIFRKSNTSIPREVALRICAIRETFEESGILLLKSLSEVENISQNGCCNIFNHPSKWEINQWREDVHNDASKFITLCRHLQSVPDIWSLGEWSNWMTPPDSRVRFDTAFFTCFVDHEPDSQHDDKETVHSQWKMPIEAIMKYSTRKGIVAPPQVYTMLQLCRKTNWEELKSFQEERANEGCYRWLTIPIKCSDGGQIVVLPGDELYPMALEYIKEQTRGEYGVKDGFVPVLQLDDTIEEFEARTKNHHRFVRKPDGDNYLLFNCSLLNGMLPPVTDAEEIKNLARHLKAKL